MTAFATTTDFQRDAALVKSLCEDLDRDVMEGPVGESLDADLAAWAWLEEANRTLAIVRAAVADRLAQAFPQKQHVVKGVGVFETHRKSDRKKWDTEELRRYVLDSRLADEDGVIADETPLDKVLDVWNLGAPRITRVRARGIDPDEFCEVEYGGLTIQKVG